MAAVHVLNLSGAVRTSERSGGRHIPHPPLRHATLLLAGGVSDAVVVEIMGHADTRILRRYQGVIPDLMRDATSRLEGLLVDSTERLRSGHAVR